MPSSLSDARVGDRYEVTGMTTGKTFNVKVMTLATDRLWAVVDYHVVGPVDALPEPWASLQWKRVA